MGTSGYKDLLVFFSKRPRVFLLTESYLKNEVNFVVANLAD